MSRNTSTEAVETVVRSATGALAHIRESISEIVARRQNLMLTACAELAAAGVEARVVADPGQTKPFRTGDVGSLVITYEKFRGVTTHRTSFSRTRWRHVEPGPYTHPPLQWTVLHDSLGLWEVLLVDDGKLLIARVNTGWEDDGHRKAVARLRTIAKHDDFRVRVRDRAVSLVDPMGNTVHEGDVTTAHAFILNIDISGAVPE